MNQWNGKHGSNHWNNQNVLPPSRPRKQSSTRFRKHRERTTSNYGPPVQIINNYTNNYAAPPSPDDIKLKQAKLRELEDRASISVKPVATSTIVVSCDF
jgi:hypothetical protein